MKNLLLILGAALVLSPSVWAQTPLASGRIVYEAMQKIDPSQMRVVINGQEVRPGGPDAPPDLPDTRSFELTLRFANGHAREEREGGGANMVMRRMQGPEPGGSDGPGPGEPRPAMRDLGRPFEESTFLDLAGRKYVEVVSIPKDVEKKEAGSSVYRTERPFKTASGWVETEQAKKIAGYVCRKATVPFRNETYTVWYTTELPFSYSPLRDLMPANGVVLALESTRETFRATRVDGKAGDEKTLSPSTEGQAVSPEQMQELRQKAMADFRQRMMTMPFPER